MKERFSLLFFHIGSRGLPVPITLRTTEAVNCADRKSRGELYLMSRFEDTPMRLRRSTARLL